MISPEQLPDENLASSARSPHLVVHDDAPVGPKGVKRSKFRWFRALALASSALLAIFLIAIGVVYWWAGTAGSLAQSVRLAQNCCGRPLQALSIVNATGSLRAGGHIDSLRWQQDGLTVEANDVSLAWQSWSLLHQKIKVDRIAVRSLDITDQRPPPAIPATGPPDSLALPLQVELDAFSAGTLRFSGSAAPAVVELNNLSGRYDYDGTHHKLALANAELASGRYTGQATLSSSSPLTLDAQMAGAVSLAVPNSQTVVPLRFSAAIRGALTALQVQASLQTTAASSGMAGATVQPVQTAAQPHASVTASITPWAAQPLPQANATFRNIDLAALWPEAPKTMLTGHASVQPSSSTNVVSALTVPGSTVKSTDTNSAWMLDLQLTNSLAGPLDQQRMPLEKLQASGEWRNGAAIVRKLQALAGGGEIEATGQWAESTGSTITSATSSGTATAATSVNSAPAGTQTLAPTVQTWAVQAKVKNINPAKLHTQFAALPLSGQASAKSNQDAIDFDVNLKAADTSKPTPKQNNLLGELRLQSASATGSWAAAKAGGTLILSALKVATDDAQISGQLEAQPAAKGGKAKLLLTAPGLEASLQGELRPSTGNGELLVQGKDAAAALRWLQKLPGMPASFDSASATGSAQLRAQWQGGWQDPAIQARLGMPSMDIRLGGAASTPTIVPATTSSASVSTGAGASASSTTSTGVKASSMVKIRDLQATLAGRLSQAQLAAQGRADVDGRRFKLQLAADAGRQPTPSRNAGTATGFADAVWQGVLKQLDLTLEDPALGAGAWKLATRNPVSLKWTPGRAVSSARAVSSGAKSTATVQASAGGSFESGAGEALLTAPTGVGANATATSALLAWQPVRWRPGELVTAGKITGLPMAWVEIFGGPQMAGAGLAGNLVFDGEWDARLAETLSLKASLSRRSGDISVLAETAQGTSTKVAAGVRQAGISIVNEGENLKLALRWDTERAGTAEAELTTKLTRSAEGIGAGGWLWAADAPLKGTLRAQLPRIGVWSVLAPPGWRIRGGLGANISVSGTRAAPRLAGELQANDLALRSVVDGIEFGKGRLRATLDGTRLRITEFTLHGAGDAGTGGTITAQGEAAWEEGQTRVQLDARIDRLRASIRTDRQVTLSGTMQAKLEGSLAQITGSLKVDQARILLPEEGTPQLGDDVVVRTAAGAAVGPKGPAETASPPAAKAAKNAAGQPARSVKVDVQLDLGSDFRVQGKGIDTQMRGALKLTGESVVRAGEPVFEPRLVGTVNTFGGQYRAYGQRLDVEQGTLRFTGAIDNPTLDILAIRPNLTQRVGVQITGTALLPRVRLYAQPELPDAEKLSWLVLGRSSASGGGEAALLQQAALALLGSKSGGMSGGLAASLGLDELSFRGSSNNADGTTSESAVTLGKRFSRNFYAAYERSISGALGTLFIFYDLSKRFTVRAQAGQQSAVDLIYTLQYD